MPPSHLFFMFTILHLVCVLTWVQQDLFARFYLGHLLRSEGHLSISFRSVGAKRWQDEFKVSVSLRLLLASLQHVRSMNDCVLPCPLAVLLANRRSRIAGDPGEPHVRNVVPKSLLREVAVLEGAVVSES